MCYGAISSKLLVPSLMEERTVKASGGDDTYKSQDVHEIY